MDSCRKVICLVKELGVVRQYLGFLMMLELALEL